MDFIKFLSNGQQFNFTRLQHNDLDCLIEVYPNISELLSDIDNQHWKKISSKISQSKSYKNWHNPNQIGLQKIMNMFKVVYENTSLIPNLLLGVSTGVGFGTTFGDYDINNPIQKKRISILKSLTKKSDSLYHAGVVRHMGVMNESYDFFKRLNELGVDVITFGPLYMKSMKDEFNISKFHQIEIPYKYAINNLDELIDKVVELASKFKNPLILSSAGHPITANLSLELKNTNISSLDIGRGFDWNLKKYRNQWDEISGPWLNHPENYLKQHIIQLRNG
jgi:hypothetical protein